MTRGDEARRNLFIDAERRAHFDAEARRMLATTNDAAWVEAGRGVVRVPKDRWTVAQSYELGTWMEDAAHAVEDRNQEHAAGFDGYRALHGRTFERAIELGCGPFTNLRIIASTCRIGSAVLLDPLASEYRKHRHCTYRHGLLETAPLPRLERWGRNLPLRALRRLVRPLAPALFHAGVPVAELLTSPIETMPEREPFDLIVMINVLEHCYDATNIFRRIHSLARPGTVFVFHDKLYDARNVADLAPERYDAGHPLRVDERVIREELLAGFVPLHENVSSHVDDYHGVDLTERTLYFVGEKR